MDVNNVLSTIIIVAFVVTVVLAVGSYMLYKLRERRRPRATFDPANENIFFERFFPKLAEFQKAPRHPKWKEANLAATLPGWKRFEPAEAWLARAKAQADAQRTQFERFTAGQGGTTPAAMTAEQRDKLFQEFLRWSEAQRK